MHPHGLGLLRNGRHPQTGLFFLLFGAVGGRGPIVQGQWGVSFFFVEGSAPCFCGAGEVSIRKTVDLA
jgi:hypothetical protein